MIAAAVLLGVAVLAGCSKSDGGTSTSKSSTTVAAGSSGDDSASSSPTATTTTDDRNGATAKVDPIGTYGVGLASFDFEDTSRETPANGTAAAHPGRKLPVLVWYPSEAAGSGATTGQVPDAVEDAPAHDGRFPVVLFSHGVTGKATFYGAVTRAWASAGYVVIGPDYPLSKLDAPGKPTITDVAQQPADASFVLDQFLEDTASRPPSVVKLADHVDADHVAAAGHSLGGVTSLGLGYSTCCAGKRIDAVVDFAGVLLPLQNEPSPDPKTTDRPLLIIHGTKDGTVPYARGEDAFKNIEDPRWFITLPDGQHIPPYLAGRSGAQGTLVVDATLDFLDAELKGDATGIDRMEKTVTDAGPSVATIESAG